eukprot:CAMPEP_0197049050 /NCGR_PEP_ID=MMETSP1384-20130603/24276_1 /TAXON_ID=29189 /ORGANISM="Ammonia sp." /LENGTH=913 /DNA_ID=CAMNT_0042481277 /DNA_START=21 /DNA_END=2762 /DNA_ORIENTATION=-
MSESDKTKFRVRIYLPTGYTCTLQLYGANTFGQLREQCWQKKSKEFGCKKNEARFRLYTTDLFFNDDQTISYFVSLYPAFEGLGTVDRYSLLLESPSERGDQLMREQMKIDGKKPIFWQGYLLKCSKSTGKGFWKKQYVVFQNQTVMLYASQDEFSKGKKSHKYIAMGSIVPQLDHHSCKTANKKFPFVLDIPNGKGTKPGIQVFAGDTDAVRRSFVDAVNKYSYFKKCSMVLNILCCLYKDELAKTEGIFRVAGESSKINAFQEQIDDGHIPDFAALINQATINNFTGLLKRQLRFMLSPIIPETHYEAFIDIGRQLTEDKRIEQLNFVIKSLAATSVVVLAELFRFLHFAVKFEAVSKMGPVNFAIVIGPNILRTEEEHQNPQKAIDDNKHMQTTIATMIVHYQQILPSQDDLYKFDRATNPKWKYGVIDPPPPSASNTLAAAQLTTSPQKKGATQHNKNNPSFGLFELARNVQGAPTGAAAGGTGAAANAHVLNTDIMREYSASTSALPSNRRTSHSKYGGSQALVGDAAQIKKVQLKPTNSNTAPKKIGQSESANVDFRAVLKKSGSNEKPKVKDDSAHSYHSHKVDFRSQMKQRKKPAASVGGAVLQKELGQFQGQNMYEAGLLEADESKEPEESVSGKMPPPNPIEVMSEEDREKQKENTRILEVFQDFEDNMAQYDEEIDFKQSFAESIVSQIMELAENNKINAAAKYAKVIDQKCRMVIQAAEAHAKALQEFNQSLQRTLTQIEDTVDQGADSGTPIATKGGGGSSYVTPGGPTGDEEEYDGGGLPPRQATENFGDELQEEVTGKKGHSSQYSYDQKSIAAALSDNLPRYNSSADVQKSAEPEKKVAKALFDYPGGYRSNELTFHRGTSLIITKEKEGWTYGYYELEPSLTGWFPKSYVKIITGT